MGTVPDKQHAHELINRLPESQMETAVRFLEFMLLDPVARAAANAPPDDEPVTDEDRRRYSEGQVWFMQHGGRGIAMEEVLSECGLSPDDLSAPLDKR